MPPTVSTNRFRKRVSSWKNPAIDPARTSPRRSESMKLDPSRTATGSNSGSAPPSGMRLPQIVEPLSRLLREGLVGDRLGLAQRGLQALDGLLPAAIGFLRGCVRQRFVVFHDGLPDLIRFHVAPPAQIVPRLFHLACDSTTVRSRGRRGHGP